MAPPSEFDLRAALRDGEGDEPDVNQVIIAGDARRAQRRSRILSAAVVIAVVGGLGLGAAEFGGSGGSGGGSADSAALHGRAVPQAAGGLAAPAMPSAAKAALADVNCPSAAPHYALSGGMNSYGSATQLFTGRVTSVVVCAYGAAFEAASSPSLHPARLELAGRQAVSLARSLETAPTAVPSTTCDSTTAEQFAVIPVDASGTTGQTVTAQLPSTACGAVVTNGTAVRYNWHPPPEIAAKLDELSSTEPPDASVSASPSPTS